MEELNPIQKLEQEVKNWYPQAQTRIDKPLFEEGVWWLDIDLNNERIVVQWNTKKSDDFGISKINDKNEYSSYPDEIVVSFKAAMQRLNQLLLESAVFK